MQKQNYNMKGKPKGKYHSFLFFCRLVVIINMKKISKKQIIVILIEYSNDTYGDLVLKFEDKNFVSFNIEFNINDYKNNLESENILINKSKYIIPIKENFKLIKRFFIHFLNDNENKLEYIQLLINGKEEIVTWHILDNSSDNNDSIE